MIVTLFRSRLTPGCQSEYDEAVETTANRVESMPGFKSHKLFVAEDGERLTLVEFESEVEQRAWATSPEHVSARIAGRARFYSEYRIQVCELKRESRFQARPGTSPEAAAACSRSPCDTRLGGSAAAVSPTLALGR